METVHPKIRAAIIAAFNKVDMGGKWDDVIPKLVEDIFYYHGRIEHLEPGYVIDEHVERRFERTT